MMQTLVFFAPGNTVVCLTSPKCYTQNFDDPMSLPVFRRPSSLAGTGKKPVWSIVEEGLGDELRFRQDAPTHGLVEPVKVVAWQDYVGALAGTAPGWVLTHE